MMGQIVKRKKKGRPPKSDLAKRSPKPSPKPEPDLRRSLRRRSVRYAFIDYDDYIDDEYDFDDEEEDEDERRKAKKLKLVVKLDQEARGEHALDSGASTSEEERGERKPVRSGGGDEDAEEIGGDDDEEVLKFEQDCAAIGFKLRQCEEWRFVRMDIENALRLRLCPAQTKTPSDFSNWSRLVNYTLQLSL